MLKLWCAGKLGNCPKWVKRFRFTCLYCRWRRLHYDKWARPKKWIKYTYLFKPTKESRTRFHTLFIDPRGHFTMLRCVMIITFSTFIKWFGKEKPFVNVCEFMANYPTF